MTEERTPCRNGCGRTCSRGHTRCWYCEENKIGRLTSHTPGPEPDWCECPIEDLVPLDLLLHGGMCPRCLRADVDYAKEWRTRYGPPRSITSPPEVSP